MSWNVNNVVFSNDLWMARGTYLDRKKIIASGGKGSGGTGTGNWYDFSITQAVKEWRSGNCGGIANNYGIIIYAFPLDQKMRTFATKNASSYMPSLIIDYDVITLSATTQTTGVGYNFTLIANITSNTNHNATWQNMNPGVATVNSSGAVTGINARTAWIYAVLPDGNSAGCYVTIVDCPYSVNVLTTPFHPDVLITIANSQAEYNSADNMYRLLNGPRLLAAQVLLVGIAMGAPLYQDVAAYGLINFLENKGLDWDNYPVKRMLEYNSYKSGQYDDFIKEMNKIIKASEYMVTSGSSITFASKRAITGTGRSEAIDFGLNVQ